MQDSHDSSQLISIYNCNVCAVDSLGADPIVTIPQIALLLCRPCTYLYHFFTMDFYSEGGQAKYACVPVCIYTLISKCLLCTDYIMYRLYMDVYDWNEHIFIYIHGYIHRYMYRYKYICMNVWKYISMSLCKCEGIYVWKYISMYVCKYASIDIICMCVYTDRYTYAYMSICLYV